ncbi:transporter [Elizabethkingia anophelis]|uniref:TolC family protein n=1 Tax=Elizabethkingia anophelis TaxID=1117645 RepID=UPI0021A36DF6|nr:TolC family protein [Elizabethkingia anophelis]MCT3947646.1 TolC family protein [Elizabethkingia anophelis]MDV3573471.1 transporter [Elizabethkingia anophelis]MDV3601329.1 transporter [Elizabethkingia anophelis]MDV3608606.1 transporter [Elizabethkingia anophelis]
MFKNLLVIISILSCFECFAQKTFTLKECVDYTLSKHHSVQLYKNKISIAKVQSLQSLGLYLPSVNVSAALVDNLKLQTTVLPAGVLGPTPREIELGTKYNTNFGIDISQPIYDASKLMSIKGSKSGIEFSEIQKLQNDENLIYNTSVSYFQYLIFQQQLDILKTNELKYSEMVKVLEYQHSKGMVLERDVDRVRVNLNTTRYQIEDTRTKERLALNVLKNAMGMELNDSLKISDMMNFEDFIVRPLDGDFDVSNLYANKLGELSVVLQKYDVRSKRASFLPTLSAVAKWGNQSLSSSFSNVFSNWNDYSYVGLSFNVPLFTGLRRRNFLKESELKLYNEELNLAMSRENMRLEFDNSKSSVVSSYSLYQSNKDNMALAEKVLKVTDYQYQRGVVSLTDYLNDDSSYKASQSSYINSLYTLMISQLSYEKSRGKLYEFISVIER